MSVNWGSMDKQQIKDMNKSLDKTIDKTSVKMIKTLCYIILWLGIMSGFVYFILINSSYHIKH